MKKKAFVPLTSRELLEFIAGEEHALHTVVERRHVRDGLITFVCSCGIVMRAGSSAENSHALRNVPLPSVKS